MATFFASEVCHLIMCFILFYSHTVSLSEYISCLTEQYYINLIQIFA